MILLSTRSLTRVIFRIGIPEVALQWSRAYLTDRKQFIRVQRGMISTSVPVARVSASVIDPFDHVVNHLLKSWWHKFFTAVTAIQSDLQNLLNGIEDCLVTVRELIEAHILKLNKKRTEVVLLELQQQLSKVYGLSVFIRNVPIRPASSTTGWTKVPLPKLLPSIA